MTKKLSRRDTLRFVATGIAATSVAACSNQVSKPAGSQVAGALQFTSTQDKWSNTHNRPWLGGEYWANPMEDWHIVDGGVQCKSQYGNRSIHSLTHRLIDPSAPFEVSVVVSKLKQLTEYGGAGIRLGVNSDIDEYRSSCFVQKGFDIGIVKNKLSVGGKTTSLSEPVGNKEVLLTLRAVPRLGAVELHCEAQLVQSGQVIGAITHIAPADRLIGNVALVSNFGIRSDPVGYVDRVDADATSTAITNPETGEIVPAQVPLGNLYRFSQWNIQGEAFHVAPEHKFGPILWCMYSLSDSRSADGFVMKLSAFTGPMGEHDSHEVELQVQRKGKWVALGESPLDQDAWVATFRIPNWDEKNETPYRVIYREQQKDGSVTPDIWTGTVQANPVGRPLRMAGLTCQNDYSFPYAPVADNVKKMAPDLVYFSGDQIYESHGGFGIIRTPFQPAIQNYLRKMYQFGWAFKEVMRNQPTICLPDDHDVLQGNLWGEGGLPKRDPEADPTASLTGGYIETVRFVNAVHRTCVSHHPDPHDPTPNPSGISCYYGDMVYGDVGFIILADRQWKSGPEQAGVIVGETGVDEAPTFINTKINPKKPELLGARQEKFLAQWSEDWRGHKLKVVLSQTVFAGVSTHQPSPKRYLKYDFDSSGWPAPARDRAVNAMRKSMALHICGDTHLASVQQYGVDAQRDSNWSFCTPAISAGWPRWWRPDQVGLPHKNRPAHGLAQTGEFLDPFGNFVYVYAVGNPLEGRSPNRYIKAHEKGSGFGFITIDTEKLTYTLEAYRYLIDVTDGRPDNQFPGWPITIHQEENKGINRIS